MLTVCTGLLVAGLALIGFVVWAVLTDNPPKVDPKRREFYRRLYEGPEGEPRC